jgi:addiction module HigA family antidote
MAGKRQITLSHPGEILLAEFLQPLGISQYRLAKDIGVSARRINEIVKGLRSITSDTALRLGVYFDMSPEFWINLQSHYDLSQAREDLLEEVERVVVPRKAAAG